MWLIEDDLTTCSALVVDANPTSRSILVSQLRDFGVGTVTQAARPQDARRQLEFRTVDFVLCEQHFSTDSMTGQDLLDDLRRNQLLPFSTVFIMITAEASYAKVAEAAESALDGYLLKPHRAVQLAERLQAARARKKELGDIFGAIDNERFEEAAALCLQRFESRGKFWLYAARVGAELLLRLQRPGEAQDLYRAVVEAKTLPWARLGVARAQLDAGQVGQATSTLENLISAEPNFADAYDVMSRAQFELGKFDKALETYKMAATLTPHAITRVQSLGMMTFYAGDHKEAEQLLDRTVRMGLDSKMFDAQTLVLLAFTRLESADRKGLQRCYDDISRLIERQSDNPRLVRLAAIVQTLNLIQQSQFAASVDAVRAHCKSIRNPEFDFESAANLLVLLCHLATRSIQLEEVDRVVDALGMRFCNNRSLTELLAGAAKAHPPYEERVRNCQTKVLEMAEVAMSLSMSGKPGAAVKNLLLHGRDTLSARLIDNATQVLNKHAARIEDADQFKTEVMELRRLGGVSASSSKATLGDPKRQAGALALRTGTRPPPEHMVEKYKALAANVQLSNP
ncbi:MAG: response regulator [Rhodoferax sp.]